MNNRRDTESTFRIYENFIDFSDLILYIIQYNQKDVDFLGGGPGMGLDT